MNVLLISECDKRALVETRRILDQFAERRGERTWQTPITQAGLDTLRRMLRKTARRNTAVACHWIRGRDHSELLWIVGDARRFNAQGAVPTDTTEQDVLRRDDEDDWHTAEDVRLLASLSALFHDFGKSSRAFQEKLRSCPGTPVADAFRHEWVSLRLFEAYVGDDPDALWLERLASCDPSDGERCLLRLARDDRSQQGSPFRKQHLAPLAQVVGWLLLSHHRLPVPHQFNAQGLQYLPGPISPEWNDARPNASGAEKAACWDFPKGLPFLSHDWRTRAQKVAREVLARPGFVQNAGHLLGDAYVMHLSRLALMLADHYYSSLPSQTRYGDPGFPLPANTDRATGALKQRLDEHLAGVSSHARRIVRALPALEKTLPRIARCKSFQRRSTDERFRWQDKAYDLARSIRESAAAQGFFGVNMASTGCGKTLANGRILYALADPDRGARFTVALGLRTLTLQTGDAYRSRLGLKDDDLGVLVGGGAVRELFELAQRDTRSSRAGSESGQALLPEDSYVHFEGSLAESPLKLWLGTNLDANKLLQAPVLTCTIDHLVPATESLRGGRQIAPMLRLLSSDLVLDEPDDFDIGDLPALSRLVHWAGLLGSRVLLSSATLPPALVEGLFAAYLAGRQTFQRNRGTPGRPLAVTCAWFDEYGVESASAGTCLEFHERHDAFVAKRLAHLQREEPRRSVKLVPTSGNRLDRESACELYAEGLRGWIAELHALHHSVDPKSGKRVSFGLIRMANIDPLIDVARGLYRCGAARGIRLHLCVYHARHPLLMRSAIERQLDATLRRAAPLAVFEQPAVRGALDGSAEQEQCFVVLASPVEEVGRDHDYDWAIVEPSSMRSLIQLAGRVRRHRPGRCAQANIYVPDRNIRGLSGAPVAFSRPGFECEDFRLDSHSLQDLLTKEQLAVLDAGARIRERETLQPTTNLVDLEHRRLRAQMLGEGVTANRYAAAHWWTTAASLTGVLQRSQKFRAGPPDEAFALVPGEDDESVLSFVQCDGWIPMDNLCQEVPLALGPGVQPWGTADYQGELAWLAERLDLDARSCAKRFGTVPLQPPKDQPQGWMYHPSLGFRRQS